MITTLKIGVRNGALIAKGARLAMAVWLAGGVVAHARDMCQDRQAELIIADRGTAAGKASGLRRLIEWFAESIRIIRMRTALTLLFYVLGVVLITELGQASCKAGHPLGCHIEKSIIGG